MASSSSGSNAASSSSGSSPAQVGKKVVLFGRTGDGKSTIANVLVTGGLEPVVFESSDAARGCTREIRKRSGRGWDVTDTVGLGEADMGTISDAQAKNMLIDFLKDVKDEYSHIIYVQKARRITTMEEIIWKLFAQIFEGAEDAFVILITAAEPDWLEANRDLFPEYWKKHTVLTTNIPPVHKRPTIEKKFKVIREESIRKLQKDLEQHFAERGNQFSTPEIARMNEEQLEQKSMSLLDYIVSQIKRFFDKASWQKAAAKFATLINVTSIILDLLLLSDAVKDSDTK